MNEDGPLQRWAYTRGEKKVLEARYQLKPMRQPAGAMRDSGSIKSQSSIKADSLAGGDNRSDATRRQPRLDDLRQLGVQRKLDKLASSRYPSFGALQTDDASEARVIINQKSPEHPRPRRPAAPRGLLGSQLASLDPAQIHKPIEKGKRLEEPWYDLDPIRPHELHPAQQLARLQEQSAARLIDRVSEHDLTLTRLRYLRPRQRPKGLKANFAARTSGKLPHYIASRAARRQAAVLAVKVSAFSPPPPPHACGQLDPNASPTLSSPTSTINKAADLFVLSKTWPGSLGAVHTRQKVHCTETTTQHMDELQHLNSVADYFNRQPRSWSSAGFPFSLPPHGMQVAQFKRRRAISVPEKVPKPESEPQHDDDDDDDDEDASCSSRDNRLPRTKTSVKVTSDTSSRSTPPYPPVRPKVQVEDLMRRAYASMDPTQVERERRYGMVSDVRDGATSTTSSRQSSEDQEMITSGYVGPEQSSPTPENGFQINGERMQVVRTYCVPSYRSASRQRTASITRPASQPLALNQIRGGRVAVQDREDHASKTASMSMMQHNDGGSFANALIASSADTRSMDTNSSPTKDPLRLSRSRRVRRSNGTRQVVPRGTLRHPAFTTLHAPKPSTSRSSAYSDKIPNCRRMVGHAGMVNISRNVAITGRFISKHMDGRSSL